MPSNAHTPPALTRDEIHGLCREYLELKSAYDGSFSSMVSDESYSAYRARVHSRPEELKRTACWERMKQILVQVGQEALDEFRERADAIKRIGSLEERAEKIEKRLGKLETSTPILAGVSILLAIGVLLGCVI